MGAVRSFCVGAVVFASLLVANSFAAAPPNKQQAEKKQQQQQHHHHVFTGEVVEIDHSKDKKGHGVIKLRVHDHVKGQAGNKTEAKGKGNKTEQHHVVTIHVNHDTRFEKVSHSGGKGGGTTREVLAHFRDLEPGMHVRVKTDHDHHAHEVSILEGHHHEGNKGKPKGKK